MNNNQNLYANMKAFADLKRNVFSLDNKQTYSQKLGEITPVKCLHTIPGDFFDIDMGEKDLSFPLNTSAFLSARKEFSVYHVPYNHVFSLFNQIQTSRPDPKTSALVKADGIKEIGMPLYHLYGAVFGAWVNAVLINNLTRRFAVENLTEVVHGVTVGIPNIVLQPNEHHLSILVANTTSPYFTIADAIRCVSDSSLIGTYFPTDLLRFWFANGNSLLVKDIHGRWSWCGMCRKLDNLGYGNIYPLLHLAEGKIDAIFDEYQGTLVDLPSEVTDKIANILNRTFWNVMDLAFNGLAFTCSGLVDSPMDVTAIGLPRILSVYPILAYNKCFYTYMRNSVYDLDYDPKNFNIDFYYSDGGTTPVNMSITDFPRRFLMLEYHQYKKDLFSGSFPTAQFGAVSAVVLPSLQLSGYVDKTNSFIRLNGNPVPNGSPNFTNGSLVDNTGNNAYHTHRYEIDAQNLTLFSVLQQRRAEMLQDYRQTLLRNGNKTSDLFKGIYGSSPASEDDNAPRFIDTFGSNVFVDTIVSTADTAESGATKGALGDLGARATIGLGSQFKFKTSDFGCLLFMSYIVPENEYDSTMIDNNLTALDPESHFLPFFQNLGFQPLHNYNLSLYNDYNNRVRGFAPSYSHLKTELSLAHGAFAQIPAERLLLNLVNNLGSVYRTKFGDPYVGSFNHWVVLRTATQMAGSATLAQFYVSPALWDNVFISKVGDDYETDHFVCRFEMHVKAVRTLSKLGLPNF